MPDQSHQERFQAHVDALTAQLGTRATSASLSLARRAAGLMMLCENDESELTRTGKVKDVKGYMTRSKQLQNLCIAIGVVLNPRTATSRQRADAAHDDHAALMLDDDA